MKKKTTKKGLYPRFEPQYVEVILDEGVREMKGNYIKLHITDIQYGANEMRIIVADYR